MKLIFDDVKCWYRSSDDQIVRELVWVEEIKLLMIILIKSIKALNNQRAWPMTTVQRLQINLCQKKYSFFLLVNIVILVTNAMLLYNVNIIDCQ